MNWLMSLLRVGMFNKIQKQMQKPMRIRFGRGTMMSLFALGVGVTALGVARSRNGRNMFQKLIQPLGNQLFR